jgi:5-methylcytosine-specific restriction protein A
VGSKSKKTGIYKKFRLWPKGRLIDVQINFPKPDKPNELRIYIPETDPFSPPAGDIWFVFIRNGELYIGHMSEEAWRKIGRFDADDAFYSYDIYEPEIVTPKLAAVFRHHRSRETALQAISRAGFQCEAEPTIPLFTARSTGKPYLEPHHLIPVSLSAAFPKSLDHLDNIYALSPHHHRRVHFGKVEDCVDVIDRLLHRRSNVLTRYGVSRANIVEFYNCNKIS